MSAYKAVCQSLRCNDHKVVKNKAGAEKAVSKSTTDCPDCGFGLLWVKTDARTFVNYVSKNQSKEKR